MALFTRDELANYAHTQVSEASAASVERVASGWLLGRVGVAAWPEWSGGVVPAQLWSLAVELGAILHENPTALSSEGLGAASTSWSRRRVEIGEEVRQWARLAGLIGDASTVPRPRGSGSPPAGGWPDGAHPERRFPRLSDVRW